MKLEEHFTTEEHTFTDSFGDKIERALTHVDDDDLNVFVEDICSQRDLNPHECKFVFGSDGGQGKFQVTLAIV